jgi:hypothetical protein
MMRVCRLVFLFLAYAIPTSAEEALKLKATASEDGVLITEGDAKVLFYQRKPKSLDGKYERANYVHPLYDLDGNVLTEDFPKDHLHHRGVFWAWHQVRVGGKKVGDPWTTEDFSWDVVSTDTDRIGDDSIDIKAHVLWKSPQWTDEQGKPKPLVDERTVIRVHRATKQARIIDFEISLQALEPDMSIGGSEDAKGYGGFSPRIRLPDGLRFMGEIGEVKPQTTSVEAGRWLDMLGTFGKDDAISGVTILVHPSTPGFPQRWILRQARSMQNPVYPGRGPVPLATEKPTVLRYRLVLHHGEVESAEIQKWQEAYEHGTKVSVDDQDAVKPVGLGDQKTGMDHWGDKEMGLQAKAIAPKRIEQGLPLVAELHLRCDPMKLGTDVRQLNRFMHDAFLELQLTNSRTGKAIAVKPYDPTSGMLAQDKGNAVERLNGKPIQAWKVQFPLARVYTQLEPGDYDCQIEFTFPKGKTSWWRGDEASWNAAGFWHGTITSASFSLTVTKETAKTTTLLLPKKLSLGKQQLGIGDNPRGAVVPTVGLRKEDTEKVTLPVRNGHYVMAKYYRDGEIYQLSSPPKAGDFRAIDKWNEYKGGDRKISYTIEVFETARRPHHFFNVGLHSREDKVLWKNTFLLSVTEQKVKRLLEAGREQRRPAAVKKTKADGGN